MDKPTLVIAGKPDWLETVTQRLRDGWTVTAYPARAGYVSRLVDGRAALIVVPADDCLQTTGVDWRFWTATPKSSPAARRIPVILVSEDAQTRHDALLSGADLSLSLSDWINGLDSLVRDYARVPDPAMLERLDCECRDPLPELAQQGVDRFNAGEYYQQHDLFEALWMQTEGPVRDLYRAILQVGVAYYQIQRGNPRGALKMLLRSVQWLSVLPDVCQGVDVRRLRDDSYRVRAELERLGEAGFHAFDHRLIQPVRMSGTSTKAGMRSDGIDV